MNENPNRHQRRDRGGRFASVGRAEATLRLVTPSPASTITRMITEMTSLRAGTSAQALRSPHPLIRMLGRNLGWDLDPSQARGLPEDERRLFGSLC